MKELIANIKTISMNDKLTIKNDKSIFSESFYFEDIYSDVLAQKFIKACERQIRTSDEYSEYVKYLHESSDFFNRDNIMINITDSVASIELHHYPFTLYDIVDIVLVKNIKRGNKVTSFDISKEVMELHSKNMIGLVPLSTTMHELAHCGKIKIYKEQIFGDYSDFISIYKPYINVMKMKKIQEMENSNEINVDSCGVLKVGE